MKWVKRLFGISKKAQLEQKIQELTAEIERIKHEKPVEIVQEIDNRIAQVNKVFDEHIATIEKAAQKKIDYFELLTLDKDRYKEWVSSDRGKAYVKDPYNSSSSGQYIQVPWIGGWGAGGSWLREMARMPVVIDVITKIVDSIADYAEYDPKQDGKGWRIVPVKKEECDEDEIELLKNFIANTGDPDNYLIDDDFFTFLKKISLDACTFGAYAAEVVWDVKGWQNKGVPTRFGARDTGTIFLASDNGRSQDVYDIMINRPKYCQVINGIVVAEFYEPEMIYSCLNPTTDMRWNGYSVPELVNLAFEIEAITNTLKSTANYHKYGSQFGLIIQAVEKVDADAWAQFKADFQSRATGVGNAGKNVYLNGGAQLNIEGNKVNLKDMEFTEWFKILVFMIHSRFQVDPVVTGYGDLGRGTTLQGGGEEIMRRTENSKDTFLFRRLRQIQNDINRWIINPKCINLKYKYRFEFTGVSNETPTERRDRILKEVTSYKTVNECRSEMGLDPIKGGDVILNAVFLNHLTGLSGNAESTQAVEQEDESYNDKEGLKKAVSELLNIL